MSSTAQTTIWLQRQPDGSFVDWGRHGPGGTGPARWYRGEAAEVLALVLRYTEARDARQDGRRRMGALLAAEPIPEDASDAR